ncbi:helix-hairpin-helix domain-containing protein [Streptococcus phocae subsp. salmonis]|uniref:helix-hairpin-helix domain-containing protein n=1 Tax=Streptococcus phocae TaxID=119224 RepID=UPI00068B112D|nr:helix-hairpin-helix domain-containing protein [Streptococcus phocae]
MMDGKDERDKVVSLDGYRQEHWNDFLDDDDMDVATDIEQLLESIGGSNQFLFEQALSHKTFEMIKDLEEIEKQGRKAWMASQPKGWSNPQERPYLSQKMDLALLYKQSGLYRKALEHLSEIYRYDVNDHLGTRYEILALYVMMSDFEGAQLFYASKASYQEDFLMAVPVMIGAILAGHQAFADKILKKLCEKVSEFRDVMAQDAFPFELVLKSANCEVYEYNSMDSVLIGFFNVIPLLMTAHYYIQHYFNGFLEAVERNILLEETDLAPTKATLLNAKGIYTLADLSTWTSEEILAISGIGQKTLELFKELGVVFKNNDC